MPLFDTTCLYTRIKNISGERQVLSFLPPHGVTLDADDTFDVAGNIVDAIRGGRGRGGDRKVQAFLNAVANGTLEIVYGPTPLIQDTATDATKGVKVTSGTLGVADPCFANSL